jgi:DNA-binding NarL/FixJ family response regulator
MKGKVPMEPIKTRLRYQSPGENLTDSVRTQRAHMAVPILVPTANGPYDSARRPHVTLTVEESTVLQAFAAGKSDKQVRTELRIPLQSFHPLLRDLMEKTGTCDRAGLRVWALHRQRSESRDAERNYKRRRPA